MNSKNNEPDYQASTKPFPSEKTQRVVEFNLQELTKVVEFAALLKAGISGGQWHSKVTYHVNEDGTSLGCKVELFETK